MANKANLGAVEHKIDSVRAGESRLLRLVYADAQALVLMAFAASIQAASADEIPLARFKDITAEAGIQFVHVNGAYGEKLLPETMGGGVTFFDFDNDGHQDLLFINSAYWPGHIPSGQ